MPGQTVSPDLKVALRESIAILGMTSKMLANKTKGSKAYPKGVSVATISALVGRTEAAVRDPRMIDAITEVLEAECKSQEDNGMITGTRKAIVGDAVYRLRFMFGRVQERSYSPAGLVIREGSSNFISTQSSEEAINLFGKQFSLVIRGRRFSGLSTLAGMLARRAIVNGSEVVGIDWSVYKDDLEETAPGERYMKMTRLIIGEVLANTDSKWLSEPGMLDFLSPPSLIQSLVRNALIKETRAVVIFDQMEALMGLEGGSSLINKLGQLIDSTRRIYIPRVECLPGFIQVLPDAMDGYDPFPEPNVVRTRNFTQQEVEILAIKILPDGRSADRELVAGESWKYFAGQPLITHRALEIVSGLHGRIDHGLISDVMHQIGGKGRGREYVEYMEGLMVHPKGQEKFEGVLAAENGIPYDSAYERLVRVGLVYRETNRLFVPSHLRDIADEMHRRDAALGPGPEKR